MDATISELAKLGCDPISPEQPAGESSRYDPSFEKLQAEVRKLESLDGKAVAWEEWIRYAKELLEKRSKDITVAGYLCLGIFHRNGYGGLAAGLTMYRDLVFNFWDTLFPETSRMRGRASALLWLSERVGQAVSRKAPTKQDLDHLHSCLLRLKEIEELLQERMGESYPGLSDLKMAIQERLAEAGQEQKEKDASEPEGTVQRSETKPERAGSESAWKGGEIVSERDAERAIREARILVRRAANALRAENRKNPLPYRALRAIMWIGLNEMPSNQNGRTQLPDVARDRAERFQGWLQAEDWPQLLEQSEVYFGDQIFWLDLHFFSDRALAGLGSDFQEARSAIQQEVAFLLQRLPGLEDLSFKDGTPFASQPVKLWLGKEVFNRWIPAPSNQQTLNPVEDVSKDDPLQQVLERLQEKQSEGKFNEAVTLFQESIGKMNSGRDRFRCRLAMAKMCLGLGQVALARPLLEGLEEESIRSSLDVWEPPLCLELLRTLIVCHDQTYTGRKQVQPVASQRREELYSRLCRLDMAAAISLQKNV